MENLRFLSQVKKITQQDNSIFAICNSTLLLLQMCIRDRMKQFGMSDEDMDNMENRMESMMAVSYTHLSSCSIEDE